MSRLNYGEPLTIFANPIYICGPYESVFTKNQAYYDIPQKLSYTEELKGGPF